MGERKGHGIKGPRHDDDVEDLSINNAGSSQQQGSMQSDAQQGSRQSDQAEWQGNQRQGKQQQGSRQGESARDASQAWNSDNSTDKARGNR